MATGSVGALKYSNANSPGTTGFSRTFSANARTTTTATQAGYGAIPAGYHGVFAGFGTENSTLLLNIFDPNAAGSDTLLSNRSVSSSSQTRQCNFSRSLLRSDLIQDER